VDKEIHMSKRLAIAVLVALALNLIATGYGTVAAAREDRVTCARDGGAVRHHECVKGGHDLFNIRL
jgi:hypothetical protein